MEVHRRGEAFQTTIGTTCGGGAFGDPLLRVECPVVGG
jgi:hypothetical protein